MDPGEPVVAAREVVELGLLAGPEDAQGQKAHQVREQVRTQWHKRIPDCGLGRKGPWSPNRLLRMRRHPNGRDRDVQDEQGHRDREDPVAERGEAAKVLPRNVLVQTHRLRRLHCSRNGSAQRKSGGDLACDSEDLLVRRP